MYNKQEFKLFDLDDRRVVDKTEITTAEHGISAGRRVVANATLTRIQFVVNDGQLEERRISSQRKTRENNLNRWNQEDEEQHSIKESKIFELKQRNIR